MDALAGWTNPDDFWDPRMWPVDDGVRRIYLDNYANVFAQVDAIDFAWAIQWCWSSKLSRGGRKLYARRTAPGPDHASLYLHICIMERTGIVRPPAWGVALVDHRNGDSLNCRRCNLRWASPKMNRANQFGAYPYDLLED